MLEIRKASLTDIHALLELINAYAVKGIMLPRTEFEMAEKLREAIRESGISILALSKLCGVAQPSLFHFMNGKDLRLESAQKLCDHYGFVLMDAPKSKPRRKES